MARQQHRCHGDPKRFEAVAAFIFGRFGGSVRYIADVAGGQGLLAQALQKRYGYVAEVIDPRGNVIKGLQSRACAYTSSMADYYDLIVGLHPDEATRAVVESTLVRPTLVLPCCNFWSEEKLGRDALLDAIAAWYAQRELPFERVVFPFAGPKNLGLLAFPKP